MNNARKNKQREGFSSLIGEPTPAKTSGLTFSVANVCAVGLAYLFFIIIIVSGLASQKGYEDSEWYKYCSYVITPLSFAIVSVLMLRWSRTPLRAEIKAQSCHAKYYLIAVLLQIGLLSLSELNALFLEFLAQFGYKDTPIVLPSLDGAGYVGVLFAVALLPAVFEEIILAGFPGFVG